MRNSIIATLLFVLLFPSFSFAATEYFGNFTVAGKSDNLNSGQMVCTDFTAPADAGTLTSLSMYFSAVNGDAVKLVIYSSTGTFLAASTGGAIGATGWATSTVSLALTPSTVYCLGIVYQTGSSAPTYDYSTTLGNAENGGTVGYSSPSNASFSTLTSYSQTIYAAYTPASSGSTVAPAFSFLYGWW